MFKISLRLSVLYLLSLSFLISSQALSQSFEDFMKEEQTAFSSYQEEIQKEFESYKKIIEEEFQNYKNQIKKTWGDELMSSPKQWVEYSQNMQQRSLVDFEENTIKIEIQAPKGQNARKEAEEALKKLITATSAQAFENDSLSQNIEKKITQAAKNVLTDTVKASPILSLPLTGTEKPSKQQVDKTAAQLMEKSSESQKTAPNKDQEIHSFTISLPTVQLSDKSKNYEKEVLAYSKERKIDAGLTFAIMHSESSFNPMAKSHIPAYGLMQIVPQSAGKDASELVYGQQKLLSPSYLYNAENNIKMGTAYLYILYYRYLSSIQNPESRLYCTIAAYNTGAGNVAKTFTGKTNIRNAANIINTMTPQQVYNKLLSSLPYEETRNYMKKVTPRYKGYKDRYEGK